MSATSVYVALPENYAVMRPHLSGDQRVTRQRRAPAALTEAHRDRLFAALARARMSARELEILLELTGPKTLPGFGFEPLTARVSGDAILVTDLEAVLLRAFRLPDDTADARWFRLAADGSYQWIVAVPASFSATAMRRGVVLGVSRDSNDVEYVSAYRLVPSETR